MDLGETLIAATIAQYAVKSEADFDICFATAFVGG